MQLALTAERFMRYADSHKPRSTRSLHGGGGNFMQTPRTAPLLPGFEASDALETLRGIAEIFLQNDLPVGSQSSGRDELPKIDAKYRTLIEQLPAVVFMVSLDRGNGEAYVSPHIEEILGYSQEDWLEDPIRWYDRIHPDDKVRWSTEAAEMVVTGRPLRSVYRVIARSGRVI